jgi:hypothetical protein
MRAGLDFFASKAYRVYCIHLRVFDANENMRSGFSGGRVCRTTRLSAHHDLNHQNFVQ